VYRTEKNQDRSSDGWLPSRKCTLGTPAEATGRAANPLYEYDTIKTDSNGRI